MSAQSPWLRRPEMDRRRALQGDQEVSPPRIARRRAQGSWAVLRSVAAWGRAMTPVPGSGRVAGAPIELRGRADGARELTPGPEPREGRWQVQDDPAHRAPHPPGELGQPLPQREDWGVGTGRATRGTLERVRPDVCTYRPRV